MANFKMVKENYLSESAIYNVIYYILNSPDLRYKSYIGMPIPYNSSGLVEEAEYAAKIFQWVRHIYGKDEEEKRLLEHFIFGFAPQDCVSLYYAEEITQKIAEFIGQRFQVVCGVHVHEQEHRSYIHIHMAVNRVSYIDGNKFGERYGDCNLILEYAKMIAPDINWEPLLHS